MTSASAIAQILEAGGLPPERACWLELQHAVDPILTTRYRVTAAGAAAIGAAGLAAAELWAMRTGQRQRVAVEGRAATAALRSNDYLTIDGAAPPSPRSELTGFYQARNGRWVYLHCNFANLRARNFAVLGAPPERTAGEAAMAGWDAEAIETALAEGCGCGAMIRSETEWNALPQAKAIADAPLLEIVRIGDAPPERLPDGDRPLSGIRVLDLTRVLAGPTCGRTLAEHGADVLRVSRPDLPDSGIFDLDTGLGKLSAFLDFRDPRQRQVLEALIRESDVFVQSYRPGALTSHGFGHQDLAALRPGIVYVTLSAWGSSGPWSERRGYDSVVQGPTGMAYRANNARPAFLPVSAQDYITGYLLAYATMLALKRRTVEGGSWMVRMSLARVGRFIRSLGLVDATDYERLGRSVPERDLASYRTASASPVGQLGHLRPIAQMELTPGRWDRPAVPLGTNHPTWPDR
jgi:CoA-transferase family III